MIINFSLFPFYDGAGSDGDLGIYGRRTKLRKKSLTSQVDESMSSGAPVVNVFLDLEGEVKLPLHEYIVSTQNRAERSGNQELAGILGGDGSYA